MHGRIDCGPRSTLLSSYHRQRRGLHLSIHHAANDSSRGTSSCSLCRRQIRFRSDAPSFLPCQICPPTQSPTTTHSCNDTGQQMWLRHHPSHSTSVRAVAQMLTTTLPPPSHRRRQQSRHTYTDGVTASTSTHWQHELKVASFRNPAHFVTNKLSALFPTVLPFAHNHHRRNR